jgi:hypothetical protein
MLCISEIVGLIQQHEHSSVETDCRLSDEPEDVTKETAVSVPNVQLQPVNDVACDA